MAPLKKPALIPSFLRRVGEDQALIQAYGLRNDLKFLSLVVFTYQKKKSTLISNYQVDLLTIFSGSEQSRTAVQIGY